MTNNIIYKATVTTSNTNDTKHYIGMTATTFKERYANHTSSFRHKKDSNKTELSKHIWKLKENNQDYRMVNFKTRYFVHRGIKTLQFMFGRKISHFERHKQRQFTQ
jgi:hypothetical protein